MVFILTGKGDGVRSLVLASTYGGYSDGRERRLVGRKEGCLGQWIEGLCRSVSFFLAPSRWTGEYLAAPRVLDWFPPETVIRQEQVLIFGRLTSQTPLIKGSWSRTYMGSVSKSELVRLTLILALSISRHAFSIISIREPTLLPRAMNALWEDVPLTACIPDWELDW